MVSINLYRNRKVDNMEEVKYQESEKQELLMEFLQISEVLKSGKKHHGKRKKTEKIEKTEDIKKGRNKKMSFSTRTTLWLLLKNGSLNQRNIAKIMNVSAQAVSEIIKKLLEQQLINKDNGEINNENIITLTNEGEIVANRINKRMNKLSEHIFQDFSEEEMETFNLLLSKIQKNRENFIEDVNHEKNIERENL